MEAIDLKKVAETPTGHIAVTAAKTWLAIATKEQLSLLPSYAETLLHHPESISGVASSNLASFWQRVEPVYANRSNLEYVRAFASACLSLASKALADMNAKLAEEAKRRPIREAIEEYFANKL